MILETDTIYYHESGQTRRFKAGEEAPRAGWSIAPIEGVTPIPISPFDHDGDGKPGGSRKRK